MTFLMPARPTTEKPPADAIRSRDAIALLAGKPLEVNSTAYIRQQGRLVRATEHGQLNEYRRVRADGIPQRWPRYYSRAQVLALRDSLERDGFTAAAASNRRAVRAIVKRAERNGLITLAAAAKRKGVTVAAARRWVAKGKFGAVKIDGLWFFEERRSPPTSGRPRDSRPKRSRASSAVTPST